MESPRCSLLNGCCGGVRSVGWTGLPAIKIVDEKHKESREMVAISNCSRPYTYRDAVNYHGHKNKENASIPEAD